MENQEFNFYQNKRENLGIYSGEYGTILTGIGDYAYRCHDGVYVVPIVCTKTESARQDSNNGKAARQSRFSLCKIPWGVVAVPIQYQKLFTGSVL